MVGCLVAQNPVWSVQVGLEYSWTKDDGLEAFGVEDVLHAADVRQLLLHILTHGIHLWTLLPTQKHILQLYYLIPQPVHVLN